MKCLCCGKTITNNASGSEKEWCWHKRCVRNFFQTEKLPALDITKEKLEVWISASAEKTCENKSPTGSELRKKFRPCLRYSCKQKLTANFPTSYNKKNTYQQLYISAVIEDRKGMNEKNKAGQES